MKTKNLTPFPLGTKVTSRRPPQPEMVLIVRAAYVLAPGKPLALPETPGIGPTLLAQGPMTAETYRDGDEERAGEVLYPGDFADWKPRAEVMLRGTCHTPGGKPLAECPVRFQVGSWSKLLRVVGRRFWSDDGAGAVMSDTAPFTKMPIGWANAFGGAGYALNPVGMGFAGRELPNVEHAGKVIQKRKDDPGPAGFGPLNPAWPQRSAKLGKEYGPRWRKERSPWYAEDLDWSHFDAAPADQQIEGLLRGDEVVSFQNLHPDQPVFETRLPGLRIRAFVKDARRRFREVAMGLDTLFVDLDAGRLYLTWRGLDPIETDDMKDVETVLVASEKLDDPRLPEKHYLGVLEAFEADPLGIKDHIPPELVQSLSAVEQRSKDRAEGKLPQPEAPAPDAVTGALRKMLDMLPAPFAGAKDLEKDMAAALALVAASAQKSPAPPPPKAGQEMPSADVQGRIESAGADMVKSLALLPLAPAIPLRPGGAPPAWAAREAAQAMKGLHQARQLLAGQKLPKQAEEEREKQIAAMDEQIAAFESEPFYKAILNRPPPVEPGPDRDLHAQDYEGRDLSGMDLSRADLRDANLARTNLRGAKLAGACLEGAVLVEADLSGADLTGADLSLANFTAAKAAGAVLRDVILDRAFFQKADLSGAVLAGAKGKNAFLPEANLSGADGKGLSLHEAFFQKADCSGADFSGAVLTRCQFLDAVARKASFARATLTWTSFAGADLSQANLTEASGDRAVFMKAKLDDADLGRAVMNRAFFIEASAPRTSFRRAILKEARFYRASVEQADFTECSLLAADFSKCVMGGARFRGANLYDAKLLSASGAGCDFSGANLERALREGVG